MAKFGIRHAVTGLWVAAVLITSHPLPTMAQQRPASPAAPAAPAAPAQPAPAAPLPPLAASHLALARSVMDASGVTVNFDSIVGNVASQLLQAYVQKRPGNARDFEEILLAMKSELDARKKELLDKATEAYARKLDEPTLKAILAFLQTPAGVKYTAALPDILNSIADASDAWTRDIATYMGSKVVDEMKKRGIDLGR